MDVQTVTKVAPWVVGPSVFDIAREHHWVFKEWNRGSEGWTFEYLSEGKPIPRDARDRMKAIMEAGIPVQYWVIAHEIVKPPEPRQKVELPQKPWKPILSVLAAAVVAVAMMAAVLVLAAFALGVLAVVALVASGGLLLTDPVLICVTSDGRWIECLAWVD